MVYVPGPPQSGLGDRKSEALVAIRGVAIYAGAACLTSVVRADVGAERRDLNALLAEQAYALSVCGFGGAVPVLDRAGAHADRITDVQQRLVLPKEVDAADIQDCQGKHAWTADDAAVRDVLAREMRVGFEKQGSSSTLRGDEVLGSSMNEGAAM